MTLIITPSQLKGSVTPPPSKSQAHRFLMAAALAGEESVVHHLADSEDIRATIGCLTELGAEFARRAGIQFPDAYYYDDLTVFANHSTGDFLNVTYHDRSYEYTASGGHGQGAVGAEENVLREKLAAYGIVIPEGAEFTCEGDGWYCFTATPAPGGAQTVSGTLQCRYLEDGTFREIDNAMAALTAYRQEEVISPREAFGRLQRGKFQGAEGLAWLEPEAVAVRSCALTYRVDTKGCYQPVYEFLLEPLGVEKTGVGAGTYLVPAMK